MTLKSQLEAFWIGVEGNGEYMYLRAIANLAPEIIRKLEAQNRVMRSTIKSIASPECLSTPNCDYEEFCQLAIAEVERIENEE